MKFLVTSPRKNYLIMPKKKTPRSTPPYASMAKPR